MDPDLMNRIAGLLAGTLPESERPSLLAGVGDDEEAKQVLLLAKTYGVEELIRFDHPFSILGGALIGVNEGFLRTLSLEGALLTGRSSDLAGLVDRLSRGRLGCWFKGPIEVAVNSGRDDEVLPLVIEIHGDEIFVKTSTGARLEGSLEVWKDGQVFRTAPMKLFASRPIPDVRPGSFLAFRFLDETQGFYLHLVEAEFGPRDWWSACLCSALLGDFAGAMRILTKRIANLYGTEPQITKMTNMLRLVGEFCRVEQMCLKPMAVFRSTVRDPGQEASVGDLLLESSGPALPEHLYKELLEVKDLGGHTPLFPKLEDHYLEGRSRESEQDEPKAALNGWKYLLEREFDKAEHAFLSVIPRARDPFCVHEGSILSRHLKHCSEGRDPATLQSSSLSVWEMVFGPALDVTDA